MSGTAPTAHTPNGAWPGSGRAGRPGEHQPEGHLGAAEALRALRQVAVAAVVLYLLSAVLPQTQVLEEWLTDRLTTAPWAPVTVTVANVVAIYGPVLLLVAVPVAALLVHRDWRAVWVLSVPAMGAFAIALLLVEILPRVPWLDAVSPEGSFPSPVLALSAALAIVIGQLVPARWVRAADTAGTVVTGALATLMPLGLWYRPFDIAGGVLVGGAAAMVVSVTHMSHLRRLAGERPGEGTEARSPGGRRHLLTAATCGALLAIVLTGIPGVHPTDAVAASVVAVTGVATGLLTRHLTRVTRRLVAERQAQR